MHTLPVSFALLTYSGYWRPVNWYFNSAKFWLYSAYTVFMVFLLYTFAFCGLVGSFVSNSMEHFIDKFSLFISVMGVCCKVANLLIRREKIIAVANMLLRENCTPRNREEANIQRKFDKHAKMLTIYCEVLNESTVFFGTVAQFKHCLDTKTLPLNDWMPYDMSSEAIFLFSLLHQTFGLMVCANASVAHETLIAGMMIQVCAQLEILCHRARTLPVLLREAGERASSSEDSRKREKKIIQDFVQHHLSIYEFAKTVNAVFMLMIFLQFVISSTVLCLSVYKMSTKDLLSVDFVWCSSYVGCMLTQIYLYCWYGNEVTLKSMQIGSAIYEMDWTNLHVDVMKVLLIIMARSTRPIKMTSGYIITLSAESFMSILKVSYSSYNLLKDSSV